MVKHCIPAVVLELYVIGDSVGGVGGPRSRPLYSIFGCRQWGVVLVVECVSWESN